MISQPKQEPQFLIGFCSVPSEEDALKIITHLLQLHLIACGNLIPKIRSLYWWQGKIEDNSELLILFKTRLTHKDQILLEIPKIHPYEVPEIIFIALDDGLPSYFNWILENTPET